MSMEQSFLFDVKGDWSLSEKQIEEGHKILESELIVPTNKNLFRAGICCIIAAAEQYKRAVKFYERLIKEELDTPSRIEENPKDLREVLRTIHYPNEKIKRIQRFAYEWPRSGIAKKLRHDINNGRKEEFNLRNKIAEEAPGLSYKSASYYMNKCGYVNVIPIDVWMLKFLKDQGFDVKLASKGQSVPSGKKYLGLEKEFIKLAEKQKLQPAVYQASLWGKYSTWGERNLT